MKAGETHRVPLSDQMVALFEPLRPLRSDDVFEGQKRHHPLSNTGLLMALRRLTETEATVHGLRSSFRDWCAEATDVPREVAELALAHRIGFEVERVSSAQ